MNSTFVYSNQRSLSSAVPQSCKIYTRRDIRRGISRTELTDDIFVTCFHFPAAY